MNNVAIKQNKHPYLAHYLREAAFTLWLFPVGAGGDLVGDMVFRWRGGVDRPFS